jgi:hypothetical protein
MTSHSNLLAFMAAAIADASASFLKILIKIKKIYSVIIALELVEVEFLVEKVFCWVPFGHE